MSQRPIDRSPDLKALRDEGYNISVVDGFVVVRDIPYVNDRREVAQGVLLAAFTAVNDKADQPADHVAHFAGDYPCYADGRPIEEIRCSESQAAAGEVKARFSFSAKPKPLDRYANFRDLVKAYEARLGNPARQIELGVTAQTYPHLPATVDESVFEYVDTSSSRAEITAVTKKLEGKRVAVLGLGGTGGYILDLVAKTAVAEIHLYDGDVFSQHNAFRAPGAAVGTDFDERLPKVVYFARMYQRMRRGIVPHPAHFTAANLDELDGLDFVFLAMEAGEEKMLVVERLMARRIPFVDVGMGVYLRNDRLGGTLRITTFTAAKQDHVIRRMPFSDGGIKNEYDKNIQIAELNALNAALAVIKFKKVFGIYADQGGEHYSTYAIGRNDTNNEEDA